MNVQEALIIATHIINKNHKHKNHSIAVAIKEEFTKYVTGEEIESVLLQFNRREDDEQFKQRKNLSSITIPGTIARVMQPITRLVNIKPQNNSIEVVEDNEITQKISEHIANYFDNKSMLTNIVDTIIRSANVDPNAYIVNVFDENETMITKVIGCESILDYAKDNKGNLLWLFVVEDEDMAQIELVNGEQKYVTSVIKKHTFYGPDFDIVIVKDKEGQTKIGSEMYSVEIFMHEGETLSAYSVGIKKHPTIDDLFVPFINDAKEIIKKLIQQISECDLTRRLHAFPRLYEYLPECKGDGSNVCLNGMTTDGSKCKNCNGTGYSTHKSTQDKVTLALPTNIEKMFDLSMLQNYANMPIDSFRYMNELIKEYSNDLIQVIYNKNIFETIKVNQTATSALLDMQSVFDALVLFTNKISEVYKNSVTHYYKFLGQSVVANISYPYNLNIIGYEGLLAILQDAKNAGASYQVIEKINIMIEQSLYVDSPENLVRINTKRFFNPLASKDTNTIQMYLMSPQVSDYDKTLYLNIDRIFMDIEMSDANFYQKTTKAQNAIIEAKVNEIIEAQAPPVVIVPPIV